MNPSAMNAPSTARSDAAVAVDVSPPTTRPAGVWTLASALSILVWIVTMGVGGLAGFRLGVQAGSMPDAHHRAMHYCDAAAPCITDIFLSA